MVLDWFLFKVAWSQAIHSVRGWELGIKPALEADQDITQDREYSSDIFLEDQVLNELGFVWYQWTICMIFL